MSNKEPKEFFTLPVVLALFALAASLFALLLDNSKLRFGPLEYTYDHIVSYVGMIFTVAGVVFSLYFIILGVYAHHIKDEIEESNGEMEKAKSEMEKAKGKMGKAKGEMEKTKGEMEKTKGEMEKTKGEMDASKNEYKKSKQEYDIAKEQFINATNEIRQSEIKFNDNLYRNIQDLYSALTTLKYIADDSERRKEIETMIKIHQCRFIIQTELITSDNSKRLNAIEKLGDISSYRNDIRMLKKIADNTDAHDIKDDVKRAIDKIQARIDDDGSSQS